MINTTRLRKLIGFSGMILPLLVLVLSHVCGFGWPASISITFFYYPCVAPFMVILGAAGVLLISYMGYETIDDIINTAAGLFGLGVCFFPTYPPADYPYETVGLFMLDPAKSSIIHNICAVGFFGLLIVNSMFLFTKTGGNMTREKKIRNIIYRVCAALMLLSVIACFVLTLCGVSNGVWIGEAVALFFFGISWLTKANCYKILFADKD